MDFQKEYLNSKCQNKNCYDNAKFCIDHIGLCPKCASEYLLLLAKSEYKIMKDILEKKKLYRDNINHFRRLQYAINKDEIEHNNELLTIFNAMGVVNND